MLVVQIFLPLALALVMFGLGLTLTGADFARVAKYPKAAVIALVCQVLVLPVICLGLVLAFGLEGVLAVGMMLLVASPGGTSANLFSHLAGGDVALNITLTAINSVLAVFTLPLVVGLSMAHFMADNADVGLQPAKFAQVFAIVLVPVAIGMVVRRRFAAWALRMNDPVRIASVVVLVLVIIAAVAQAHRQLVDNIATLGPVALLLSVLSLLIGYYVPKAFKVDRSQAVASAMEIGIHNATIAITLALTVLNDETMAVPPAVYGVLMYLPAAVAARLLSRTATTV
ncbi:bile acid:Na+ symporter, BASS family [Lentzea xinjiangensis]|uniref:Bile acid:Na+ symporter, BASS family n=1 Tax=Lentzea xinjiangensis TaxID=402600 RepID=A0A1H9QH89_9PSEU|nr:bile acid:sodium symporter family protein [Lentzea xinjiangensis]SER59555.1 bile acid:Na+ symporter, BASS family [Lentzea xinjiangensis]